MNLFLQVMPHGKCERLQSGRMRENKDELCYMCKGINLKTESSNTSAISEESLFDGHRSRGCRGGRCFWHEDKLLQALLSLVGDESRFCASQNVCSR